jgi:hypothetical protein
MNKYAVSIFNNRTREHHIFDAGHFSNEVRAGYITAGNELGIEFPDNDDRVSYDVHEMYEEFQDNGYSIAVCKVF